MTFGQRLKTRRNEMHLTGTALGLLLEPPVTKQTIAHWEAERYNPHVGQVAQLCKLLRVSADVLVMGIQPSFSSRATELALMFDSLSLESKNHWEPILGTMNTQKHLSGKTHVPRDMTLEYAVVVTQKDHKQSRETTKYVDERNPISRKKPNSD